MNKSITQATQDDLLVEQPLRLNLPQVMLVISYHNMDMFHLYLPYMLIKI